MTISYSGNFCRLLIRWKGSIWRLVWRELFIFLVIYYAIRFFYVKLLPMLDDDHSEENRRLFEHVSMMFDDYTKLIPLTFLLGFYISNVVTKWWRQFECLPWPEDFLSVVCVVIPGKDERSQRRRHIIARYTNLAAALAFREISSKIRRRFPSMHELITSGLLTENELKLLNANATKNVLWMTPIHWIQQIIADEVTDNAPSAALVNHLIQELKSHRISYRRLFCHDWVCVPLVYTQVAALATYAYFAFCLIGRQFLDPQQKYKHYEIDFVVPVGTIIQFLFYVGWFKVGQELMRPFGLDDDDIELDYIFERNVSISFAIVNGLQMSDPAPLEDDAFWSREERKIQMIPNTGLSCQTKQHRPKSHVRSYISASDEVEDGQTRCITFKRNWAGYDEMVW